MVQYTLTTPPQGKILSFKKLWDSEKPQTAKKQKLFYFQVHSVP